MTVAWVKSTMTSGLESRGSAALGSVVIEGQTSQMRNTIESGSPALSVDSPLDLRSHVSHGHVCHFYLHFGFGLGLARV